MSDSKVVETVSENNLDWIVPLEKSEKVRIRVYVNPPREIQATKILSVVQICRNDEDDGFCVMYCLDENGNRSAFFPVTVVRVGSIRLKVSLIPESAQKTLIRVAESAMNILRKQFEPEPLPAGRCYDIVRYAGKGRKKKVEVFDSTDGVLRSLNETRQAVGA